MTSVADIEKAIRQWADTDLAELRDWFAEFDAERWDAQFESDANLGRLDRLAAKALGDHHAGRSQKL